MVFEEHPVATAVGSSTLSLATLALIVSNPYLVAGLLVMGVATATTAGLAAAELVSDYRAGRLSDDSASPIPTAGAEQLAPEADAPEQETLLFADRIRHEHTQAAEAPPRLTSQRY